MVEGQKVIGIICECNPFHEGHKRLIDYAKKKADTIIAVMSGNFVQRGEPAIYHKYKRAKDLIKNGVDMVIEIPVEYVLSSAKYYARSAVSILDKLGIVDNIIFGSKIADIDILKNIADIDDTKVSDYMKEGLSYPHAIEKCYNVKLSPNDILGVEYIKAIKELKSKIVPLTIKRKSDLPSASEIRKTLEKKIEINSFSDILTYKIFSMPKEELYKIYTLNNDLANAIINTKNMNLSFEDRARLLNKKNRTLANIKRSFFNIIFGIKDCDIKNNEYGASVPYIRILGMKKDKISILKNIKVPYLMSYAKSSYKDLSDELGKKILDNPTLLYNVFASNMYYLLSSEKKTEATSATVFL